MHAAELSERPSVVALRVERRDSNPLRLAALLLAVMLAGCATRPGPELLNPTHMSLSGTRTVTVYVATTRVREEADRDAFTGNRAGALSYAEFKISVPPGHRSGNIEWSTSIPDPRTSFATVSHDALDRPAFEQKLASRDGRHRKVGVFIHGFNTNFPEALFRLAQIATDADADGALVLFAWPSEGRVTGYLADKDAATYSRDQLVDLLTMLARNRSIADITVVGHSMGGWLTVEALRQLRLTGNNAVIDRLRVILAAPDIDIDVFRAQTAVIGPLSPPMMVLVSRDDVALAVSGDIAGKRQRLGALDVNDPRVQQAALDAKVQIVDISDLQPSDGFKHDRYVGLAALYPQLTAAEANGGRDLRHAGAFIFNAVGATLSSPFSLAGSALAGE